MYTSIYNEIVFRLCFLCYCFKDGSSLVGNIALHIHIIIDVGDLIGLSSQVTHF